MGSNVNWAVSLFYLVLEKLNGSKIELTFWEGEENWVSILINNKIVGYVWKKRPLVIIEKEIALQIKNILKDINGVHYLEVKSLREDLFQLEDEKELREHLENFNKFNSFTINDLWFETNSI